jgi:hypothetical protein
MAAMRALSPVNIESELSYAYLHAVASKAGMVCREATRHEDNNGIDATLTAWAPFPDGGYLTEVDLKVQLKATVDVPADDGKRLSYHLKGVAQYDDLRTLTQAVPRILVVLFLPKERKSWLGQSAAGLVLRKCAYWESLRGAPATTNAGGVTVKLPKAQKFTPDGLLALAGRLSHRKVPTYPTP